MNAPTNLSKVKQLRDLYGDRCWLCDGKLNFAAASGTKGAPTVEHLLAKSNGGGNGLENLRLTHDGCNKQLGCKSIEEKERIREKYRASREKSQAARNVRAATPRNEGGNKPDVELAAPFKAKVGQEQRLRLRLRRWQVAALAAGAMALFASGLAIGLLV